VRVSHNSRNFVTTPKCPRGRNRRFRHETPLPATEIPCEFENDPLKLSDFHRIVCCELFAPEIFDYYLTKVTKRLQALGFCSCPREIFDHYLTETLVRLRLYFCPKPLPAELPNHRYRTSRATSLSLLIQQEQSQREVCPNTAATEHEHTEIRACAANTSDSSCQHSVEDFRPSHDRCCMLRFHHCKRKTPSLAQTSLWSNSVAAEQAVHCLC
jgi:hypothetical protein